MERQAKDGTIYAQVGPDEWAPVTRQAKDGTVFSKVGPDEWRPLQNQPQVSKTESALRGAAQGLSLGYADEISGAVESAISDKTYEQARDESRSNFKKAQDANPNVYMAGEIGGGVAGAFVPGAGVARGAKLAGMAARGVGAGAVAGSGFSEEESIGGLAKDAAIGGAIGGVLPVAATKALRGGQRFIERGAKAVAEEISPPKLKLNAQEIKEAADRLGIKVTPGMLDDSGFVERLEATLANSPSKFGQSVARNRSAVTDKLSSQASELTNEATNLSPYQVGEQFKSGVSAKVGERLDPISTVFKEVQESTKFVPITDRSKAAVIRNIENLDTYKLTGGAGKPQTYVEMLKRTENADQVKTMMTLLNEDIAASAGAEKRVLIGIKEKLANLEDNSIMRAAIKTAKEGGMRENTGKQIGMQVVSDLKDARKEYRKLIQDLQQTSEAARIKVNKGPSGFLDTVESIPSERVQDKFFNIDNNRQLSNLKEKFPEQFELLRQGKMKDILDGSTDSTLAGRGEFSTARFLKEVNKLNPEAKQMMFGENLSKIGDIETVQRSLPRNFNPSGTAGQLGWQDAIYQNVKDVPNYLLYRGSTSNLGRAAREKMAKIPNVPELAEGYKSISGVVNRPAIVGTQSRQISLPSSVQSVPASNEKPLKGQEKWANDGLQKLKKSGNDFSQFESELLKSPKGKRLLIAASDLKPGSKAFQKIASQIEKEFGGSN